ncbi:hypothetical protein TYRP_012406 [Tyrophagus putrescentiae]|nr:hypothetical protein TYRP_005082 [Tyrophagus putrescentiae]KAH9407584.1 hypothetical protein TYRP_012406 [Tyrophagus putrescentiae]
MHHYYQTSHQANFINNNVSSGGYCDGLFTSKDTNCFLNNLNSSQKKESEHIVGSFVSKALLTKAAALRLAFFSRKSILSKTQTEPIEGVIIYFKNELYFLLQIAYSAKNYLHIFISKAVLLIQKNKNNSNWTRFTQPVTSLQEQNIELIAKEFAYTYE